MRLVEDLDAQLGRAWGLGFGYGLVLGLAVGLVALVVLGGAP